MTSHTPRLSRRTLLLQGGGLAAALSGCGGGSGQTSDAAVKPSVRAEAPLVASKLLGNPGLGAMLLQNVIYEGWRQGPKFDAYQQLAANGVQWARTLITTESCPELDATPYANWSSLGWKNAYWSCREMGAKVLAKAAAAGMRLQLGLFLSDVAADGGTGRQTRPVAWSGLSDTQLIAKVQEYSRETAAYFKGKGLDIEIFEIGNETDFGICGYELGVTIPAADRGVALNDVNWMRQNVWSKCIPIYKAAIAGVRSVYPGADIALHISAFGYSWQNATPKAFYEYMISEGVDFQIAGVSYPYSYTSTAALPQPYYKQSDFTDVLDHLRGLGKRVQIIEFSFPASATDEHPSSDIYPLTETGQAQSIADFYAAVSGRVERINYWAADVFPGINGIDEGFPKTVESYGLFSTASTPRIALTALRRAASDLLFDWAETKYQTLFPTKSPSAVSGPYYYRYYPATQMYLGIEEATNSILLHNGRDLILFRVGALRDFMSVSQP